MLHVREGRREGERGEGSVSHSLIHCEMTRDFCSDSACFGNSLVLQENMAGG